MTPRSQADVLRALRDPRWALLGAVIGLLLIIGLSRWWEWPLSVQRSQLVTPVQQTASLEIQVSLQTEGDPLPVKDAEIVVFSERDRWFEQIARARSDAEGRARLERLAPGPVWVLSESPGHARVSRRVIAAGDERVTLLLVPAQRLGVRVLDDQRVPIAGATVLVRSSDPLPYGALTDAEGRTNFERLAPGPHAVQVFARGYEAAERDAVSDELEVVLRRLGGLDVSVVDRAGAPVGGAEVAIVGSNLWPPRNLATDEHGRAELAGLVSGVYDLRARKGGLVSQVTSGVRLERGERRSVQLVLAGGRHLRVRVTSDAPESRPIADAAVVLAELGLSPFPLTARSNAEGFASLGPLPTGVAYVSVRAKGYVPREAVPVPEDANEIHVALYRGATLRGRVVDEHDHAIAGASLEVIGTDRDGLPIAESPLMAAYRDASFEFAMKPLPLIPAGELGVTLGHVPYVTEASGVAPRFDVLPADYRTWTSDVEGRFRLHPVPAGRMRVLVRHPAYVEGLSEVVVVVPGGDHELRITLREGARLSGRVVDSRGYPVGGARVLVSARTGSYERSVFSARDGTFQLSAVPRDVLLSLARPGDAARFVKRQSLRLEDGRLHELEIELPDARDAVSWRVVDEDERPVELAQLSVTSLDPEVPLRLTRFSAADGAVSIDDVAGLRVRIALTAPGFVPSSEELRSAPSERVLVLRRGVRVQGRLTGIRGRLELAGARVTLTSELRRDTAVSDARGRFEFAQVPRGAVTLRVEREGYASFEQRVNVEDTGRSDRPFELETIDLEEGVTVRGVVVDALGEPVARARISAGVLASFLSRGALPPGTTVSDEGGRFTLSGLRGGELELTAVSSAKGRGSVRLEARAGDELDGIVIELRESDDTEPEAGPHQGGLAVTLGERDDEGGTSVVIVDVSPDSEAERAGLAAGDVLVSLDGHAVRDMREARRGSFGKDGSDVVIGVRRAGQELSFRVRREPLTR